ncbi:hypothetical protein HPP92_016464 [Vanilla planifolia]|uniref:Heparanase-like protein 3 n=1 Tax=Vanilla planifolia TaxID=51239 RepID=A0A835QNQ9_VANPL|nr:hypothetical protein HPP92_017001 [Vanilla planifolia]KAG0471918.1 hypothetical protein HPP92_016464 [Vanilla planifolia]
MAGMVLWSPAPCLMAMLLVLSMTSTPATATATQGSLFVDGNAAIASTDENFICATLDWWPPEKCDYGVCSWGEASILNLQLSNRALLNAVKAFSPLIIRLGGSLDNVAIYQENPSQPCGPFVMNTSAVFGFSNGCLPLARWDELNKFFNESGAAVVFGLNALNGRVTLQNGTVEGPWNYQNAESLIRYTANKGYTSVFGWELGNELSGMERRARVQASEYVKDVITLKSLVNQIYKNSQKKPLVMAPGGNYEENWFRELIEETKPSSLDVISYHKYSLGPGKDEHLVEKILDPSYLDVVGLLFSNVSSLIKSTGTTMTAWIGEAGGAYNSGRNLVTNSFVSSFWYLDQLALSAKYNTKSYCRQSLVGGNYGLLDTNTFSPNPDYYSALLWHRLMGPKVLSTNFQGSKMIRAYAHCAKHSNGTTLLLLNLDQMATTQVQVSSNGAYYPREEYHLTARNGNLHSQTVLLNGNDLLLNSIEGIPELTPIELDGSQPINVAPLSIVFAHIPDFPAPACL